MVKPNATHLPFGDDFYPNPFAESHWRWSILGFTTFRTDPVRRHSGSSWGTRQGHTWIGQDSQDQVVWGELFEAMDVHHAKLIVKELVYSSPQKSIGELRKLGNSWGSIIYTILDTFFLHLFFGCYGQEPSSLLSCQA